jgi:hypothetical protein
LIAMGVEFVVRMLVLLWGSGVFSMHVLVVVRRITDAAILLMADAWDGCRCRNRRRHDWQRSRAEGFVECGVLPRGFARARCGACGHALLVPFS